MRSIRFGLAGLASLASALIFTGQACGGADVDIDCRANAGDCAGDIGGACEDAGDCSDGTCCHDKNCGDGMCTYLCEEDLDCPEEMACEHGYCFFRCERDEDCSAGQGCEHGQTICEYEGGD